jgi:hypothetical protein
MAAPKLFVTIAPLPTKNKLGVSISVQGHTVVVSPETAEHFAEAILRTVRVAR